MTIPAPFFHLSAQTSFFVRISRTVGDESEIAYFCAPTFVATLTPINQTRVNQHHERFYQKIQVGICN